MDLKKDTGLEVSEPEEIICRWVSPLWFPLGQEQECQRDLQRDGHIELFHCSCGSAFSRGEVCRRGVERELGRGARIMPINLAEETGSFSPEIFLKYKK